MWKGLFKGDFDSFFAVTAKLQRLRDRNTGEYSPSNFDRVEKLECEYGGKHRNIVWTYYGKLLVQTAVCIGSVIVSSFLFVNFSFSFNCPRNFMDGNIDNWPLNTTISCVFTSLRVLALVRIADYILVSLALVLVLYGLGWCFVRHTKELGHIEIASFCFASTLPASSHVFPRFYRCCQVANSIVTPTRCRYVSHISYWALFTPRIQSDLDFLLMQLFRADPSHGRVFKEIQIEKYLSQLYKEDHEKLHLFADIKLDRDNNDKRGKFCSELCQLYKIV